MNSAWAEYDITEDRAPNACFKGVPELPEAWMREVDLSLSLAPQLLLTGNVRDLHRVMVLPEGDPAVDGALSPVERMLPLSEVLATICQARGYAGLLQLDPLSGLTPIRPPGRGDGRALPAALTEVVKSYEQKDDELGGPDLRALLIDLHAARTDPEDDGAPIGLVVPYAARIMPADGMPDPAERTLMTTIEALGHSASTVPSPLSASQETFAVTIFWICEQQEHLHSGFPIGSGALRVIRVPLPDLDRRHTAARYFTRADSPPPEDIEAIAGATDGMTARHVRTAVLTAASLPSGPSKFSDAARLVRVGITEDPWASATIREQLSNASAYLSKSVLGQPEAVEKTVDILVRAAVGLTGAQSSSTPNRPRGVLFLAGPTGVGKTELARSITKLLLGKEASPVRFDMSEFRADESRQRLIGAPPGYVGYDSGGELTNAVRAQPASVLLFDEVEKAHERILDLFLQILDDGRLTDSRGATVYFTECFLIFTSNLGATESTADGESGDEDADISLSAQPPTDFQKDPARFAEHLRQAYVEYFDKQIGRPELRNRFGDSYVSLGYIDSGVARQILDRAMDNFAERVLLTHKARLSFSQDVRETLAENAVGNLALGARGVLNLVESALVNPVSRRIFDQPCRPGEELRVTGLYLDGTVWRLELTR
ncbi:AAA family ATPase [Streptomyces phaeochromogenes]|uniref:AAA family ATPase n=1 Tax=Streptomyces phaeochromogenes TaxID=1923 RepID=UPI0033C1B187